MLVLFLAIQQYLLSKITSVTYIRMWNNNLDMLLEGKDEVYQLPAIWVEFPDDIQWQQIGNGCQEADIEIRLHMVTQFYDATDGTVSQDLFALKMAQDVYKAFQDWMPSTVTIPSGGMYNAYAGTYNVPIGVMVRSGEQQDKNHPEIYHFIQTYTTTIVDRDMDRPVGGQLSATPLAYNFSLIPAWQTGNLYVVGNQIGYTDGNVYECILNTTTAYEDPTNSTYWNLINRI